MNKMIFLAVLALFFLISRANGEVILFHRIFGASNSPEYQCKDVIDEFAVKTLRLLEQLPPPDPLYDELWLVDSDDTPYPDNIDCVKYLDKQYQYLQDLATQQNGFSDILLLKYATKYLNELYYWNPFDEKGRLIPLIKENVDKDKPIYPYLLKTFRQR